MFEVVVSPPLGGGEDEPLAHVGNPSGPGTILVGCSLAAFEAVDDRLTWRNRCSEYWSSSAPWVMLSVHARRSSRNCRTSVLGVSSGTRRM